MYKGLYVLRSTLKPVVDITAKADRQAYRRYVHMLSDMITTDKQVYCSVCDRCGCIEKHILIDNGVVPMISTCSHCNNPVRLDATLGLLTVTLTNEWYRPTFKRTLELSEPIQEHIFNGGLAVRRLATTEEGVAGTKQVKPSYTVAVIVDEEGIPSYTKDVLANYAIPFIVITKFSELDDIDFEFYIVEGMTREMRDKVNRYPRGIHKYIHHIK